MEISHKYYNETFYEKNNLKPVRLDKLLYDSVCLNFLTCTAVLKKNGGGYSEIN